MTTECKCSFAHRVVGDGCRYCQPQTYIDNLELMIAEMREEEAAIGAGGVERLRSPAEPAEYPPLPDLQDSQNPLWEAISRWEEVKDPHEVEWAAHEVDRQIGLALRAYVDADRAARAQAPAAVEPVAQFDDPRVQAVYDILCSYSRPPADEHWEGFTARRIVDALITPAAPADAPTGFALVPLRLTPAMDAILAVDDWQWEDLLAVANAITKEQHAWIAEGCPRTAPADALDAETALLKVLSAVQRYLPPDGISIDAAMSEIIEAVDPWPIGNSISAQRAQQEGGA